MARYSTIALVSAASLTLTGCLETEEPAGPPRPPELALFGDGYPNAGDPCLRSGESAFTADYLDDAADLVACPPGTDPGLFAYTTGGREVARLGGWILFSIPRR